MLFVVTPRRRHAAAAQRAVKKVLVTNLAGAAGRRRTHDGGGRAAEHIRMFRSHTGVIRFLSRSRVPPIYSREVCTGVHSSLDSIVPLPIISTYAARASQIC